jgi:hypothetical protein
MLQQILAEMCRTTLKMAAENPFNTVASNLELARRHIPEGINIHP